MRLIDAEKLESFLNGLIHDEWNKGVSTSWADAIDEVLELIKSLPTIEAEPVRHGYWKPFDDYNASLWWRCSRCGYTIDDDEIPMNYCPECGARMDGDASDGEE